MPTRVILIRHGQTDWNKERRYLSRTDLDLNDYGRTQADWAKCEMLKEDIARVYASSLKRAISFARLIFGESDIEARDQLKEMDFGDFEGLTYEEVMARHAKIYSAWIDDPHKTILPGGESFDHFCVRIMDTFNEIVLNNTGKTVAIVTHGGVIRLIMWHVLKTESFWEVNMVKPGSVNTIQILDGSRMELVRYEPEGVWPKKV
jgi:broad specificity phosphatase PhoE